LVHAIVKLSNRSCSYKEMNLSRSDLYKIHHCFFLEAFE